MKNAIETSSVASLKWKNSVPNGCNKTKSTKITVAGFAGASIIEEAKSRAPTENSAIENMYALAATSTPRYPTASRTQTSAAWPYRPCCANNGLEEEI